MKDYLVPVLALLCLILAVALIASLSPAVSQPTGDAAATAELLEAKGVVAEAVVARNLTLLGSDGKPRIVMQAESQGFGDGPRIAVFDEQGKLAYEFRCYIHANVVEVHSPNSDHHVEIGASESGGSLTVWEDDLNPSWEHDRGISTRRRIEEP